MLIAETQTLQGILSALEGHYPALIFFVRTLSIFAAFVIMAYQVGQLIRLGDGGGRKTSGEVMRSFFYGWLAAIFLINANLALGAMTQTLLAGGQINPFDYNSHYQEPAAGNLRYVIHLINFIGLIATIRAFFRLNEYGIHGPRQQGEGQKIMWLLIAGLVALNITQFVEAIAKTFNMPMLSTWIHS